MWYDPPFSESATSSARGSSVSRWPRRALSYLPSERHLRPGAACFPSLLAKRGDRSGVGADFVHSYDRVRRNTKACWGIERATQVSGRAACPRQQIGAAFRDAKCGRFHPANTFLVHEIVAKTALGIDL